MRSGRRAQSRSAAELWLLLPQVAGSHERPVTPAVTLERRPVTVERVAVDLWQALADEPLAVVGHIALALRSEAP